MPSVQNNQWKLSTVERALLLCAELGLPGTVQEKGLPTTGKPCYQVIEQALCDMLNEDRDDMRRRAEEATTDREEEV